MTSSTARRSQDIPDENLPPERSLGGADGSMMVDALDRLIAGRVQDLEILKEIAVALNAGGSRSDIHQKLLKLARSSREAFQTLQSSRDKLVSIGSGAGAPSGLVDPVTELPGREAFEERLAEALARAASKQDTVVMLAEIGALPTLVAEAGSKIAHRMVRRFAYLLKKSVKHSDFVARISPQHFAIIFENLLPESVASIAVRIHGVMERRFAPGADPVMQMLSVTIGITPSAPDEDAGALLQRAEDGLLAGRKQIGVGIYMT